MCALAATFMNDSYRGEAMAGRPPESGSGQPGTGGPSPVLKDLRELWNGRWSYGNRCYALSRQSSLHLDTHMGDEETNFGFAVFRQEFQPNEVTTWRSHMPAILTDLADPHVHCGTDSQQTWIPITMRWRSQHSPLSMIQRIRSRTLLADTRRSATILTHGA